MIYVTITGDQPFSVGEGSPAAHRRAVSPVVSMSPIRASAELESEADGFDIEFPNMAGVAAFLWPPIVGAAISVFDQDAVTIASGTVAGVTLNETITLSVLL